MSLTHSESVTAIAAALVKLQTEIPNIAKDNTASVPTKSGGKYEYSYADLTSILDAIKPLLAQNELSVTQHPGLREDSHGAVVTVETFLLHKSGEWMRSEAATPLENTTPQGAGAAITYMRRYALAAILGLGQEDYDGNVSAPRRQQQRSGGQQAAPRGQQRQSAPRNDAPPTPPRQQAPAASSGEWTPEAECRRLYQKGFLQLLGDNHLTLQEVAAGLSIAVDESRPPQKQVFDGIEAVIKRDRITVEVAVQRVVDWYAARAQPDTRPLEEIEAEILAEHGNAVPA